MRRSAVAALLSLFILAMVPTGVSATPRAVAAGSVTRVKIVDGLAFRPATVHIARGDVVKWVNKDNITHTSTSSSWDSGRLGPGDTFKRRFRRTGTFTYRCSIHASMTGTVVVG